MKRTIILLTWICAIWLWVVSCSLPGTADPLANTAWQLQQIDGGAVPAEVTVTLILNDGQIGGNGGCNSYGGTYRAQGDQVQFTDMLMTEMYCEGAGSTTEQQYMAAMMEIRAFTITNGADTTQLALKDDTQRTRLVFVRIEE